MKAQDHEMKKFCRELNLLGQSSPKYMYPRFGRWSLMENWEEQALSWNRHSDPWAAEFGGKYVA